MKSIVYPGTFDPVTLGHLDLLERSIQLFDEVIIAVSQGRKPCLFTLEERIDLIEQVIKEENIRGNVRVKGFNSLLVNFLRENDTRFLLRGLRTVMDFELEFQLANANRTMYPELETVFLIPDEGLANISSSLVREIAALGGNLTSFVHPKIAEALSKKHQASSPPGEHK